MNLNGLSTKDGILEMLESRYCHCIETVPQFLGSICDRAVVPCSSELLTSVLFS